MQGSPLKYTCTRGATSARRSSMTCIVARSPRSTVAALRFGPREARVCDSGGNTRSNIRNRFRQDISLSREVRAARLPQSVSGLAKPERLDCRYERPTFFARLLRSSGARETETRHKRRKLEEERRGRRGSKFEKERRGRGGCTEQPQPYTPPHLEHTPLKTPKG